jgi:hypothetical protein
VAKVPPESSNACNSRTIADAGYLDASLHPGYMRNTLIALCGLSLVAVGTLSAQQASTPEHNHWRTYQRKLIGKGPLARTVLSTTFAEITNAPHEWGRTWDGLAKRAGNSVGQRTIKATVELGVSTWSHEDLRYRRLGEGSFVRRMRHAALSTVWVPRDNGDDSSTLAVGRISGAFAAGMVSRAWMPPRVATFNRGMQAFGTHIGFEVGVNMFREFWPRKR